MDRDVFDAFQNKAKELTKKLGLTEWSVKCRAEKLEHEGYSEARICYGNRSATLVLSDTTTDVHNAERGAVFCVCNVLFADLEYAMQRANIPHVERGSLQNAIIRRLEKVL